MNKRIAKKIIKRGWTNVKQRDEVIAAVGEENLKAVAPHLIDPRTVKYRNRCK